MSKIKVGQIGTGHSHAAGKMEVLRASDDFEVVGVVEADAELRSKAQREPVYADLACMTAEELLATPSLQAVVVETQVPDLLDAAEQSIAAGVHIHLDKPPGSSLGRLRRLLDAAAKKHLTVQMGYMYRYNPGVVFLRRALADGWLGQPFELNAVMSKQVREDDRPRWAEYAGGSMFELGAHLVDLVVGLLGKPTAVHPYVRHSRAPDDPMADNILAVLEYPGVVATVRSTAIEVEGGDRRHIVLCGTEGTVHVEPLDDPRARLALSRARGDYKRGYQDVQFPEYHRYVDDMADLARIIRGEKDPDFSYEHDLAAQETLLRACGMPLDT